MAVNQLALSWKDHHNILISVFENLLEKKTLVDCTLAAEGKSLKAHKIVLSACSPYLQDLLNQENDKHPIIFLRDVNFQDLKALVDFVYSGKIEIPEDRLVEFLSVAEALQIKGLGGVENKAIETKPHIAEQQSNSKQRDASLPVPRKRVRRISNSSSSNSHDRNEIAYASSVQRSEAQHNKISRLEDINTDSNASLPRETIDITEEFGVDVSKIKEEVINCESNSSLPAEEEQCINESVHSETGDEHSELAPKFEEVTFTEQYSNDVFHEERDVAEAVIDPVQNRPSSSSEYSALHSLTMESCHVKSWPDPLQNIRSKNECIPIELDLSGIPGLSSEPLEGLRGEIPGIVPEVNSQATERGSFFVQPRSSSVKYTYYQEATCSRYNVNREEVVKNYSSSVMDSPQLKKHQCPICFKWFRYPSFFRRHIITHTGEKPYQCGICRNRFSRNSALRIHLRTIHSQK